MHDATAWLALLGRQTLALSLSVALLLALRRPLLCHFGPGLRYAAWALVPLLMLASSLPPSRAVTTLQASVVARLAPRVPAQAGLQPAEPAMPSHDAGWLALWATGLLIGAWRQVHLQRRYQQTLQLNGDRWRSPAGTGPALLGLLAPRVVLPADFDQRFDATQRALVLAHEDVHRTRRDNHWNSLATALCLLHWFNPLAWLALHRMRADQELSCDAAVLARHPGSEAAYSRALLLAQGPMPAGLPWAGWQSPHPLVERIQMLKLSPHSRGRRVLGLGLIAGLALATTGVVQALNSTPAANAPMVDLKMDLSYTTGTDTKATHRQRLTLRVAQGERGTVMLNGSPSKPAPDQIAVDIEAQDLGGGRIQLQTEVKRGDPLVTVSRPRLITHNGVQAVIEQGRDDPSVTEHLSLAITPTLLAAPQP